MNLASNYFLLGAAIIIILFIFRNKLLTGAQSGSEQRSVPQDLKVYDQRRPRRDSSASGSASTFLFFFNTGSQLYTLQHKCCIFGLCDASVSVYVRAVATADFKRRQGHE